MNTGSIIAVTVAIILALSFAIYTAIQSKKNK